MTQTASYDRSRLKRELAEVLNWDELVVESVVEAIASARDTAEVEDIISNFMAESEEARKIVMNYVTTKVSTPGPRRTAPPKDRYRHHTQASKDESKPMRNSERKLFDPRRRHSRSDSAYGKGKHGQQGSSESASRVSKGRKKMDVEDLDVQRLPIEVMERTVVNCLGCGKIYDARKVTEAMYKFVDSGGICDFCGTRVSLTLANGHEANEGQSHQDVTLPAGEDEKEAGNKAREFKDRLVDYDRNSAQRTTVLDDQSDYFEIETNIWLEEKEKKELRIRRDLEEEITNSLRKKVHYTIDLLGRRVFVSEDSAPSEEARKVAEAALAAAQSTSEEIPQGGGTAVRAANEAVSRLTGKMSDLQFRANVNPDIKMASPIFLPSKAAMEKSASQRQPPKWIQGHKGRLQHDDVFADFDDDAEPVVTSADIEDYAYLFSQNDNIPFDLCPHDGPNRAAASLSMPKTEPVVSANARMSSLLMPTDVPFGLTQQGPEIPCLSPGDEFPDGVVLMKNWLSFEDQLQIVETVRNLGIGEGGFYTPMHEGRAQMKLKIMCLGWNWNPTNRIYEKKRTNHDGAPVPPLPGFVHDMSLRCVGDANRLRGSPYPKIDPNVCICNFYAQDSHLGLHQDKEEGPESLGKQIPVISFTIGATGEFVFSKTRSTETAQSVLLESGDALIFGGPSRMLFHGIRKIFPESMPPELTEITGMQTGRLNLTIRQYIP